MPTKHSNVVTIRDQENAIATISYIPNSLVISAGQPYDVPPAIKVVGNGVTEITLQAGRHKTAPVAQAFNNLSGGKGKAYAPSGGGGGTPDELNFMFGVTVAFRVGGTTTLYIGQGSYGFIINRNNWWIGGATIFNTVKPQLEYTYLNKIYTFDMSGDTNTFSLKLVDTRPVSPIQNVFVLMLENHSFDNMLAFSGIKGIDAATTSDSNSYNGTTYNVQSPAIDPMPTDPGHEFTDTVVQLAGQGKTYPPGGPYPAINNSGFAANYAVTTTEGPAPVPADIGDIMKCFQTQSQMVGMYQLASQFVVCDHWFSSLPGPTWPNRYFLHGASSNGLDHSPSKEELFEWETFDGFRYPKGSIFDAMQAAGISYRLFHDTTGPIEGWIPQVSGIHNIDIWDVHEISTFQSEVGSTTTLYPYQYTFIEPSYGDIANGSYEGGSSQHPMDGVSNGDALIAKVYETIRNSPIWERSVLIVTYDEHGGFYDHVAPKPAPAPDDGSSSKYNESGFLFNQYGVRVPGIVVSPYGTAGVDDTLYDHASVLATIEWLFGLAHLTDRDKKANRIKGIEKASPARTDAPKTLNVPAPGPVQSRLSPEERAARELEPVPDRSTLMGFLGALLKSDTKIETTPEGKAARRARFQSIRTRGDARAYIREVLTRAQAEKVRRGIVP